MKKELYKNRALFFANLIKKRPRKNYVGAEIGVYRGDFSFELMKLLPIKMYLVDPYVEFPLSFGNRTQEMVDQFFENVKKKFDGLNVELLRHHSSAACAMVPDDLDFVFIDADKDLTYEDITLWDPKVTSGIVGGHDYSYRRSAGGGEVIRAVQEYAGLHDREIKCGADTCWYWVK